MKGCEIVFPNPIGAPAHRVPGIWWEHQGRTLELLADVLCPTLFLWFVHGAALGLSAFSLFQARLFRRRELGTFRKAKLRRLQSWIGPETRRKCYSLVRPRRIL
jgi:hypothetical protein